MQHTMIRRGGRSVADGSTNQDLLHREPKSTHVGAVEGRLDASPDWASLRSTAYFCPYRLVEDWWDSTTRATPLEFHALLKREGRDLPFVGERRVPPLDRVTDATRAFDRQSRSQAQWRSRR